MRVAASFAAAAALALAAAPGAQAQFFHRNPPPPQQNNQDPAAMCAQMKGMPNAPMTYEACMQMAASAQAVQAAGSNTAGARPGDDAMTCDQIKAEIVADGGLHIDKGRVTQAQSANQNLLAKSREIEAQGTAMAARQSAENMAVGAASLTPAGGAVGAAVAAQQVAEQQAFNAHAQQVLNPATNQAMSANAGMMNDIASQMQANPRVARLMSLGAQKNCH